LSHRGLDFTELRLYVLDGGKALHAAVKRYAGESALIQRCQVHKRRNVLDHLSDEHKPLGVQKAERGLRAGRLCGGQTSAARIALRTYGFQSERGAQLGRRIGRNADSSSSPRSPETAANMASTNVIESAFAIVERVCKNVKRWHGGDQRERWVGSGLIVAEKQFQRVKGHKLIPVLIREMEAVIPSKKVVVKRTKAS
jgi:putative transposase